MMRFVSLLLLFLLACGRTFAAGSAIPSGAISASGNQLTTQAGQNIRAACVDYTGSAPATDMPLMRSAGFNCVRVGWFDKTLSLPTLDAVVSAAAANSMRVIIAHLGNEASAACGARQGNGVWYDLNGAAPWNTTNNTDGCGNAGTVLYSTFKTNWTSIAAHYAGNETVMGFDLHHEPVVNGAGLTAPVNWGGSGSGTLSPHDLMLAYLQSIAGSHILIGQTSHADNFDFNDVTSNFGFSPAIMFNDPWVVQFAGFAGFDGSFISAQLAHAAGGGIVGMSLLLPNPVDLGPTQGGAAVDPVALLTNGTASNTNLKNLLDQAAGLLQQHKNAGNAVLTRFLFELDGGWFWWGSTTAGGQFTPAQQTQLFQYITNYLRVTKGLTNILTTFSINGGPGSYQYPGDAFVDIVGMDPYTDTFGIYKTAYDGLRAVAPSKPIAFTEAGSGSPSAADQSYDLNRFKADVQGPMPLLVYANWWTGWRPSLYVNGKAASSDPYWVNKAQVHLPTSGGGTGPSNGSDALAMCNDVGAAATAADSLALIICEGPVNAGTLFNGVANSTAVGDLTLAQTNPVVGTTSGGTTRNTFDIPFTSASVWNIGIGSAATWSSNGDADAVSLHSAGGGINTNNFGAPLYFGQQSDPFITITAANFVAGTNVSVTMHVPAGAVPSNDSDAEINLLDSTQPTVAFAGSNPCTFNNHTDVTGGITCGIGNVYNPLGNGITDSSNYRNGVANYANDSGQFPGIITDYDVSQGVINHAVRYAISRNLSLNPGPGGNGSGIYAPCTNVPWPAYCVDGDAQNSYSGNILAGSTLGIPASVNLATLGLSQGGLMLATALQKYGALWRDSAGTNQIAFYSTPENASNALIGQANGDMGKIIPVLQIMRNQSGQGPTGNGVVGQINGGGNYPTPLATGCAQAASTFAGTNCAGGSGVPISAAKVVYSVHEFPQNVGGRNPDSSTPWITLSNTAYGYLEKNNIAPVFMGSLGASLDGSNGAIGDDQGWASTVNGYLNGSATNGPSFAACQQPMSMSWHLWGNQPTLNPNGILNADGTFKSGQQAIWSTLQFTPSCTGGSGVQTTWNPSDNLNTTLTGNNLIATTNAANGAVRSTTSKSTGKVCAEFVASANLTADWDVGLADSTFALNGSQGGLGGDTHGGGIDLLSGPGLGIFFNNVILSSFGTAGDVTGNKVTMCADLDVKQVWFTSNYMRAQGNPWNNSATANPATATGGLSFSGLTCPCFLTYQNFETASAATLNTRAPFAVGTPAGFSAWDTGVTSTTHPTLINLGSNDNLPLAANDDVRVALNLRRSNPQ